MQINTEINKYKINKQTTYTSQQVGLGYNYFANTWGFDINFNYNLQNNRNTFNYVVNNVNNIVNFTNLQIKVYNPYNLDLSWQYNLFKANDLTINMLLLLNVGYALVTQLNSTTTQAYKPNNNVNDVNNNNNNLVTQEEIDNNNAGRGLPISKTTNFSINLYNPTPEKLLWYANNNYICVKIDDNNYKCTLNNGNVVNPQPDNGGSNPNPNPNPNPQPDNGGSKPNPNPNPNPNQQNINYSTTTKTTGKYINGSVGLGININYNLFNNLAIYGNAVFVLVNRQFVLHGSNSKQLSKQNVIDGYKANIGLKYEF